MHMQAFSLPTLSLYLLRPKLSTRLHSRSPPHCNPRLRGNPAHGICLSSAGVPCLQSGLWDCQCGYPVNFSTKCEAYGEGLKIFFRFFPIVSLHIEKVFQFSISVLQSFLRMGASWQMQRSQPAGLRTCNVLENLYLYFRRIPSFASICNEW